MIEKGLYICCTFLEKYVQPKTSITTLQIYIVNVLIICHYHLDVNRKMLTEYIIIFIKRI